MMVDAADDDDCSMRLTGRQDRDEDYNNTHARGEER